MTGQSGPAHLRWTWQNPARPGSDRVLGPQPRRIFLLHAPTDRALAQELIGHMQPLIKQRLLDAFEPAKLLPGDNTSDVLDAHLDTADAVLVLVSASLFQHGPWQEQLTRAIARQKDGARVIPVLVRAVIMDGTSLAELQPLPEEGLPVTKWDDRDEAWTAVVSGLRRVLLSMA